MPAPYQPFDPTNLAVESFDIAAMTKALTADDAFDKSGRIARTLARGDRLTVVLTAMKKDAELHEHSAPGPVAITLLSGSALFSFDESQDEVTLSEGSAVVFASDASHRVRALEDTAFLIVIGGRENR